MQPCQTSMNPPIIQASRKKFAYEKLFWIFFKKEGVIKHLNEYITKAAINFKSEMAVTLVGQVISSVTFAAYLIILTIVATSPSTAQNWWNEQYPNTDTDNTNNNNNNNNDEFSFYGFHRESYPSPTGGIIYRSRPDGRRQSRNPNQSSRSYSVTNHRNPHPRLDDDQLRILFGEICDPHDPVYNKCTENAECISSENNLHRCNCTEGYDPTTDKKCRLSWGQYCTNKDVCNYEAGLVCVDNRCECDNSDVYQYPSRTCRSKVGGTCTPPSTELGVRFSKANTGCVKNAVCKAFGPSGLSFRCVCKHGYVETRFGYCAAGVGMPCHGKGECDLNIPLVCKQGICACRDSLHVYDPTTNSCLALAGGQCCSDEEGLRCISSVRTGCVEGAFCKENHFNLPGRCICQSFYMETEERLCKLNPNV